MARPSLPGLVHQTGVTARTVGYKQTASCVVYEFFISVQTPTAQIGWTICTRYSHMRDVRMLA